jgi:hypothetical protein
MEYRLANLRLIAASARVWLDLTGGRRPLQRPARIANITPCSQE